MDSGDVYRRTRVGFLTFAVGLFALASLPATSPAACPNDALRAGPAAKLAECRAYELVSPADKNGGTVFWPNDLSLGSAASAPTAAAPDGEGLLYLSYQTFPGAGPSALLHSYRSRRSADGWTTADLTAPIRQEVPSLWTSANFFKDASEKLDLGVLQTNSRFDPLDNDDSEAPPTTDIYMRTADGSFQWLSRSPVTPNPPMEATYQGHSGDWNSLVFGTPEPLVSYTGTLMAGNLLYAANANELDLVNVDDSGAIVSECGAALGGSGDLQNEGAGANLSAVSADGARIAFTVPDPAQKSFLFDPSCEAPLQLYVRDGQHTVHVSESQRATADPAGTLNAVYQGSSVDGAVVYFTSAEALTEDATPVAGASDAFGSGRFLYAYDVPAEELRLVTPNKPDGSSPGVNGVVAIDRTGDSVYFVVEGERLEHYDGTAISTVAVGAGITERLIGTWNPGNGGRESNREARISPDGSRLLFATAAPITAFDNHGLAEVYLYEGDGGGLTCVSCGAGAHVPVGGARLRSDMGGTSLMPRNLLGDGRVVFETGDALVGTDSNKATDVYLWERGGGVRLLSDGRTAAGSYFVDAGADGRDVFFSTTGSLVGWDTDNGGIDLYDARQGGGFPEPAATPAPCQGDGCQGEPNTVPAPPPAGSGIVSGPGNRKKAVKKHAKHKQQGRKQRKKHRKKHKRQGGKRVANGGQR